MSAYANTETRADGQLSAPFRQREIIPSAIMKAERKTHLWLAKTVMRADMLEGEDLAVVVMEARRRLSNAAKARPDVDWAVKSSG